MKSASSASSLQLWFWSKACWPEIFASTGWLPSREDVGQMWAPVCGLLGPALCGTSSPRSLESWELSGTVCFGKMVHRCTWASHHLVGCSRTGDEGGWGSVRRGSGPRPGSCSVSFKWNNQSVAWPSLAAPHLLSPFIHILLDEMWCLFQAVYLLPKPLCCAWGPPVVKPWEAKSFLLTKRIVLQNEKLFCREMSPGEWGEETIKNYNVNAVSFSLIWGSYWGLVAYVTASQRALSNCYEEVR